jgi:hypothetical protein
MSVLGQVEDSEELMKSTKEAENSTLKIRVNKKVYKRWLSFWEHETSGFGYWYQLHKNY